MKKEILRCPDAQTLCELIQNHTRSVDLAVVDIAAKIVM